MHTVQQQSNGAIPGILETDGIPVRQHRRARNSCFNGRGLGVGENRQFFDLWRPTRSHFFVPAIQKVGYKPRWVLIQAFFLLQEGRVEARL